MAWIVPFNSSSQAASQRLHFAPFTFKKKKEGKKERKEGKKERKKDKRKKGRKKKVEKSKKKK